MLNQKFKIVGKGDVCASGVTDQKIAEARMYLVAVMDLDSRRVVASHIDKRMRTDFIRKSVMKTFNL